MDREIKNNLWKKEHPIFNDESLSKIDNIENSPIQKEIKEVVEKKATLNADGTITPCGMNHDNNIFKKHGPKMKPIINEIFDEIEKYALEKDNQIDGNDDLDEQSNQIYKMFLFLDMKLTDIQKNLKRLDYKLNKIANENKIKPTSKLMLETFHEYFKEEENK